MTEREAVDIRLLDAAAAREAVPALATVLMDCVARGPCDTTFFFKRLAP